MSRAGVAQLVEHHVANVIVVGSSPITRSIFPGSIPHVKKVPRSINLKICAREK